MTEESITPQAAYRSIEMDPISGSAELIRSVTVSWQNLSVGVAAKKAKNDEFKDTSILHDISGEALPGELLAIVGPAGSGKTTLLDCLMNLRPTSSGHIHVNGVAIHLSASDARYIPKDSRLYSALTVHEHLMLQAELRLGPSPANNKHVIEILDQLELTAEAHSLIGDDTHKARHKLVSIATELLSQPPVLLLDDPIAELDHLEAQILILQLHKLARKGHTVVIAAQKAPSLLFDTFDKLYLMADGNIVFHGKPSSSIEYLKTQGLTCPTFGSPFEFFAEQLTMKDRAQHLVAAWSNHRRTTVTPMIGDPLMELPSATQRPKLSTQFGVLAKRTFLRMVQDKATFKSRLISMLGLAIILGLVFPQLDLDQTDIQPFTSACFFFSVTQFVINGFGELGVMPEEVPLVIAEHKANAYHALTWYVVKSIVEFPQQLFYPLVFLSPAYFIIGYSADAEVFFSFYLFLVLVVSCSAALVYFASSVAPNPGAARPIFLLLFVPFTILGGTFVNRNNTPSYLLWLQQISPIKYGYHGMMRAYWKGIDSIYCPPNTSCRATSGAGVLKMNVIKSDKFVSDVVTLIVINLTLRVLAALALWRRSRSRQK